MSGWTFAGKDLNMNICTYVSAVSRKPKLYMIAIDPFSKTFENLGKSKVAILQILSKEQIQLVKILGKKSGFNFSKDAYLKKRNLINSWQDYSILRNCCAYLLLSKIDQRITGDHFLFTFEVLKSKTLREGNVLMFQDLINHKVILG